MKVLQPRYLARLRCLSFFPTLFFELAFSSAVFKQQVTHRCNMTRTSQADDFPKRQNIIAHNQIWICTRTKYLLQCLWRLFDGPKARKPYCGLVSIDGRRLRSRGRGICLRGEPYCGLIIELSVRVVIFFIVVLFIFSSLAAGSTSLALSCIIITHSWCLNRIALCIKIY